LPFSHALKQLQQSLENAKLKINKIVACSQLGTRNSKIYYDNIENLYEKEVYAPFCFIIPSKLHFLEEDILEIL
jgi:diphthamide biosynthesis methyltransferase